LTVGGEEKKKMKKKEEEELYPKLTFYWGRKSPKEREGDNNSVTKTKSSCYGGSF